VSVLLLAVLVGFERPPSTPLAEPDADKLTLPLKPFCAVTVIALVPVVPCTIFRLFGAAERTKVRRKRHGEGNRSYMRQPTRLLRVTVMLKVPRAAVLLAVSRSTCCCLPCW